MTAPPGSGNHDGLRVLTIIDSLAVGGAERSLAMLTPHLTARNIEMHVAYLRERDGVGPDLIAGGARLHSIAVDDKWIRSIFRAVRLIRQVRPDVIHTTLFKADIIGRVAAALTRTPVISSFVTESYGPEHYGNPEYRRWKVREAHIVDAATARFVRRFHSVSEAAATVMARRLRISPDAIDVISRGRDGETLGRRTDERRDRARSGLGIEDDRPLILAAARHYHMKGLDVLTHAFAKVRTTFPDASLVIAGRYGPATEELEQIIADHELGDAVRLVGYRDDVADLMCAADVFALPSRAEGSPGALIEAMALEVPTVASEIPSVCEVAGYGNPTAELCVPGSPDDLARGIIALIDDPDRSRGLTEAARSRFEARYAMDAVANATVDLYFSCVSRRASAAV